MSKKSSAWAHKNVPKFSRPPTPAAATVLDMVLIWRDSADVVHTPSGYLPATAYEAVRAENPALALPPLAEIPLHSKEWALEASARMAAECPRIQ